MGSKRMASRIELWGTERLIPYSRNARTHSEAQVQQIASSILEFGFNNPILVDSEAGIVAGHGRLLAAQKLALEEVPVIVLDHLTDAQRRAYVLADNKLALNAGWDEDLLSAELKELHDEGFDLDVIGFSDEELADLLESVDDDEGPPDTGDKPILPVCRPGEVWGLGKVRLTAPAAKDAKDSELRSCDLIILQWQERTRQDAILVATEQTFNDLTEDRAE